MACIFALWGGSKRGPRPERGPDGGKTCSASFWVVLGHVWVLHHPVCWNIFASLGGVLFVAFLWVGVMDRTRPWFGRPLEHETRRLLVPQGHYTTAAHERPAPGGGEIRHTGRRFAHTWLGGFLEGRYRTIHRRKERVAMGKSHRGAYQADGTQMAKL